MASHLNEEASWAATVAHRLRLVQANCVEEPPVARLEFLSEEIERALKDLTPSKRKASLQALAELFPAWNVAALPDQAVTTRAELIEDTPEARLESLLRAAPDLAPEQRNAFAQKLKQAGFAVEQNKAGPVEPPAELVKLLNLPPGQPLDTERAIKLLSELTQLFLTLDQSFWKVLTQILPRPGVRGDLKSLAGKYLLGDAEVATPQVKQSLDQSRTLIAGLLIAMGSVGLKYAKKHEEHFSPDEIRVQAELARGFKQFDAKCWERYLQLYSEFGNQTTIGKEIQDALAAGFKEVTGGRYANT